MLSVNKKAKFYTFPRETWQSLWLAHNWRGYGEHFLGHKHKELHVCVFKIPLVYFFVGIKTGLKGYKLTYQKKSLLLPLAYVFMKIAWWFGFIKGHNDGYGHKKVHA